ncbi:MAG: hypothetical protein M3135_00425 [Actinomycetota bacterium]|nr:hypothetical protein [Actinomycetota bacterium]
MRRVGGCFTVALVMSMMVAAPALAHRERGTGGRVWVKESRPQAGYLVVSGGLRQRNRTDAELSLRCRIEVTTTEGRTGATWRRMVIDPHGAVLRKWRVLITDSDPDATASDVHVPHCHEA